MSTTIADIVAVRVPERTWRSDLRAVKIVWRRELIRFAGDRMRMFTSLIQPLLFLFSYGFGSDFDSREARFLRSEDGGRSWTRLSPPEPLLSLAIDPADRRHIVVLGDERGYVCRDGGSRWRPLSVPGGLVTWTQDRLMAPRCGSPRCGRWQAHGPPVQRGWTPMSGPAPDSLRAIRTRRIENGGPNVHAGHRQRAAARRVRRFRRSSADRARPVPCDSAEEEARVADMAPPARVPPRPRRLLQGSAATLKTPRPGALTCSSLAAYDT
jgi:hypothetical protein